MQSAGLFKITVSDPYPCWVTLTYDGKEVARFHHGEIMDLAYVAERARKEAIRKLPVKEQSEV